MFTLAKPEGFAGLSHLTLQARTHATPCTFLVISWSAGSITLTGKGVERGSERTDRSRCSAKEHPVLLLDTEPAPHNQEKGKDQHGPGDPVADVTMTVNEDLTLAWSWSVDHVEEQSWPVEGS
ncbi:hypothetical protein E2C01_025789 [Portunus trituberculatus]|uniref:Uncharacterized protein n=1 Tax=Portunus trituberculatus TaxID=210409 RepID=A0A5B7EGE4_PORTR|nr:hypothetical protein [Portunus trituberculatus]